MKNRFTPALFVFLLLIALTLPNFIFAQQSRLPADRARSNPATRASGGSGAATTTAIERDVSEALTLIEENYVDGANLNYNETVKSSIIGMLRTLDPHSNYYDRQEFEELRNDQRSEYFGIGASINNWRIDGDNIDTYIMATFEGSPAQRAGLRYGDRIVEVDGQPMRSKSTADVRDRIRGPRGSEVRLVVERAATGRPETIVITRDAVPQPSIPDFYMLRPGVGYVDMTRGFNTTTNDELERALTVLQGQGMTSLVLDLRNNPGGFLDQAVRIADRFLQRGQVILTQRGRTPASDCSRRAERSENGDCVHRARNDSPDYTPLTVLINRGSASASEIVAGALQDHDRGLIVGETSFGKGLVQSIFFLEYGAGLTLTSAKYYTPSGRLIQRDYSNGSLYDYYVSGTARDGDTNNAQGQPTTSQQAIPQRPAGQESRTDAGRVVYSGGGIAPDESVRPRIISPAEGRLLDSLFAFSRELVNGRIAGFDAYRVPGGINYRRELQSSDFPVTDALVAAYKRFVASRSSFNITEAQIDRHRDFVTRRMRSDMVSAAYGTTMAQRALNLDDPQILRSIEAQPRARELATAVSRGREQRSYE